MTLAFPVPQELFPVEHRFLEIGGHRIHYVDEGRAESPDSPGRFTVEHCD